MRSGYILVIHRVVGLLVFILSLYFMYQYVLYLGDLCIRYCEPLSIEAVECLFFFVFTFIMVTVFLVFLAGLVSILWED